MGIPSILLTWATGGGIVDAYDGSRRAARRGA